MTTRPEAPRAHLRSRVAVLVLTAVLLLTIVLVLARPVLTSEWRAAGGGVAASAACAGIRNGTGGATRDTSSVKFVSLTYNGSEDLQVLEHNCVLLSRAGYTFELHTDDLGLRICKTCTCVPFSMYDCVCPNANGMKCVCNKLHFVIDSMQTYDQYVFLDSDLVIMNDAFMPALLVRTEHFDFIAAYGFPRKGSWTYRWFFNSGLFFIRRIDGLNYTEMIDIRDKLNKNGDQIAISEFVHAYYERWDVLSLRWHCRFLYRSEYSIDPKDCLTYHGHDDARRKNIPDFEYLTL